MNKLVGSPAKYEYRANLLNVKRFFEIIQKILGPNPSHIIGYRPNTFIHPNLTNPAQKGSGICLKG
jgi:hypothetical protein